ncbi:MAG: SRPBCC family protein [Pseudomonadota bacterium]
MTDVQLYDDHLTIERNLPAPPEKVWEYLVNPELRQKWFCAGATDDNVDGTIHLDFDHSRISNQTPQGLTDCGEPVLMKGTLTAFDPPHRLAFIWHESEGGETHVTITLTARDGGTTLHLVHDRIADAEHKWGVSAGWHAHLDLLVDLISGQPARDFWGHYGPLEAMYKELIAG